MEILTPITESLVVDRDERSIRNAGRINKHPIGGDFRCARNRLLSLVNKQTFLLKAATFWWL